MAAKAVTVTLGPMAERAETMIAQGRYATMSELVRAGLRALEREEAALDAMMRQKVAEALADPRPTIPIEEAFEQIFAATRKREA